MPGGAGRTFCSQRCRQWEWVSRERAHELALSDDELVIARTALDELHDQLYALACAVEDTDADCATADGSPPAAECAACSTGCSTPRRPLATRQTPAPSVRPPVSS